MDSSSEKAKKRVGLGFLGSTLDRGPRGGARFDSWRPTLAAVMQPELKMDRYEIFFQMQFKGLLDQVVADIKMISPGTEIVLHQMEFTDAWDFQEVFAKLHDFAHNYNFKLDKEDYYLNITTGTHVVQICLFLLAESKYLPAKLLQIGKEPERPTPKGTYKIIDLDLMKYDPIAARFVKEKIESAEFLKAGIHTQSKSFNQMIERIETIAMRSQDPILLMGRTGAGKTELARRIFQLKQLKHKIKGRFVEVNCATLKGDAVMSTLFGHTKGAFTGALKERAGLLKEADEGLIFLDEIGELGLDEQAMLLRAIEDKRFLPMGSDKEMQSNFQLIAGTNRDLKVEIEKGRFREDLFARINLWCFRLPDLRERQEDIEPNLDYELMKFSTKTGKKVRFTQEGIDRFLKFATEPSSMWKENFRDLNAAITRMGTFADSGKIGMAVVEDEIARLKDSWKPSGSKDSNFVVRFLGDRAQEFDSFDLVQLEHVLNICARSKSLSEAGRSLFEVSRGKKSTSNDTDRLKKYLARFGLDAKSVVGN